MNRLAKVIRKAALGEDVTIGVIGGSITEGTGLHRLPINGRKVHGAWQATLIKHSPCQCGHGCYGFYDGVHRADDDLLSKSRIW